jgi:CO/xanthine dehydrogenase Mo-binding subunit
MSPTIGSNDGRLVGWRHRIVGQSTMAGTAFAAVRIKNGIDRTSVEGAANLPYAVPNMVVELKHHRDRREVRPCRVDRQAGRRCLDARPIGSPHVHSSFRGKQVASNQENAPLAV